MDNQTDHLKTLSEIRTMMERSSRFISLSGLSGVFAGMFAIAGVAAAYNFLDMHITDPGYYHQAIDASGQINRDFYFFFIADAVLMLVASIATGSFLTIRKAKQKGQKIWDATAKRLLVNILIPVVAGTLFCLALLQNGMLAMIAPATLVFYGLALINASKYTLDDVRYLGITEIILGLIAAIYVDYGLVFWAIGFGLAHIIYGIVMYYKYER